MPVFPTGVRDLSDDVDVASIDAASTLAPFAYDPATGKFLVTSALSLTGPAGPSPTIQIGTVTTTLSGIDAAVTRSVSGLANTFNFSIPRGFTGLSGLAATVAIGTVATLSAGSTPTVVNVGSPSAAVLNFAIPAGAAGTSGGAGPGLAAGGSTGQFARKASNADYDTAWTTITPSTIGAATPSDITTALGPYATSSSVTSALSAYTTTTTFNAYVTTAAGQFVTNTSLASQLNAYATLASPALSGTPTAPTASSGTNTTQVATTAFVQLTTSAAISQLVNGAGTALDQLNELAAALGNDPNFSTTVMTAVGNKLAKASNLSDLASASTSRTNLGLGSAALRGDTYFAIAGSATGSGLTMSTNRLIGRSTASAGAFEEIAIGTGLAFSGGTLSATSTAVDLTPYVRKDTAQTFAPMQTFNGGVTATTFTTGSPPVDYVPTGNEDVSVDNGSGTLPDTYYNYAIVAMDAAGRFSNQSIIYGDEASGTVTITGLNPNPPSGITYAIVRYSDYTGSSCIIGTVTSSTFVDNGLPDGVVCSGSVTTTITIDPSQNYSIDAPLSSVRFNTLLLNAYISTPYGFFGELYANNGTWSISAVGQGTFRTAYIGNTSVIAITSGFNGGSGAWIDMPTNGPSGIGTGGAGANVWIGYVSANGNWMADAAVGDLAYRNFGGSIRIATASSSYSQIVIASSGITVNKTMLTQTIASAITSGTFTPLVQNVTLNQTTGSANNVIHQITVAATNVGTGTTQKFASYSWGGSEKYAVDRSGTVTAYGATFAGGTLSAPTVALPGASGTNGIGGTSANAELTLWGAGSRYQFNAAQFYPTDGTATLGRSANRWGVVYATGGDFSGAVNFAASAIHTLGGSSLFASSANVTYLYVGTSGLKINNQANTLTCLLLDNAGNATLAGSFAASTSAITSVDTTTGSAGLTSLLVNATGTGTGTGAKLLIDLRNAGASVASITRAGAVTLAGSMAVNGQLTGTTATFSGATVSGVQISAWNSGNAAWIAMPTTGPSAIGSGSPGSTVWIGLASAAGAYFGDAAAGDIVYRASPNKTLRFGVDNGGSASSTLSVSSSGVTVTGGASISGDLFVNSIYSTGSAIYAPNGFELDGGSIYDADSVGTSSLTTYTAQVSGPAYFYGEVDFSSSMYVANSSTPGVPASGAYIYALGNRLLAKFPDTRVAELGGPWSRGSSSIPYFTGDGTTHVVKTFVIPAGRFSPEDKLLIEALQAGTTTPGCSTYFRLNGGTWFSIIVSNNSRVNRGHANLTTLNGDTNTLLANIGAGNDDTISTEGQGAISVGGSFFTANITIDIGMSAPTGASFFLWWVYCSVQKANN